MKNNKLLIGLAVAVVVLILFALVGKKAGWFGGINGQAVAIEKAQRRSIIELVTASGKIHSESEVKISSEVSGEIIQLNVKEGDSVNKGDLLIVINPAIYESVVAQTEASVHQTEANRAGSSSNVLQAKESMEQERIMFERTKKLHDDKIIADAEFEAEDLKYKVTQGQYETALRQAEASGFTIKSTSAQLKQAKDNLAKTKIFAPASGVISALNVKIGERVVGTAQMAGTELMRISNLNNMQAEVDVNENDVLRVDIGDTADVEVDAYLNKKFKGVVKEIAYSSSTAFTVTTAAATNFTVKIRLLKNSYSDLIQPEKGHPYAFRPGMSTTVDIKTQSRENVISVPIQSVTTRSEEKVKDADFAAANKKDKKDDTKEKRKEIVFVVEADKVKGVEVKTGIQDANYIEIESGLAESQAVVKAPFKMISKTLKDGDLVKVVKEKDLFKDTKE